MAYLLQQIGRKAMIKKHEIGKERTKQIPKDVKTEKYDTSREDTKLNPENTESKRPYIVDEIQEGLFALEQANRKYKDRLFRFVFQDKKNLLSLYNAMNGSHYTDEDQLEIFTVENVLYMNFKGDISFLVDPCLYLYEHQSSYNPNMGVRGLIYFAQSYNKYMEKHRLNRFGAKLLSLPKPVFVVFYNGTSWQEEETTLRLSDCFEMDEGEKPCVEVVARMLNINYGKNKELMERCKPLMDYAVFVKKVRDYRKEGGSLEAAINRAIDECIQEDRLRKFLEQHRAEVVEIMLDSYSFENYQKIVEYEKEQLEEAYQDLQNEKQTLQKEKQTLQNEKQTLQNEKQTLQNELEKSTQEKILSMIQMALEYGADEPSAIRKTAEKCKADEEFVTKLWDAYKEGR